MAKANRPDDEIEQDADHGDEDDEIDEEEEEEEEEEDEDDEGAHPLTLTVPNDDPELHTFLNQLAKQPGDRDLVAVFADKLEDRSDSRSELVRDLASPGVYPGWSLTPSTLPAPMVAARFWAAYHLGDRVHAAVYPLTALDRVISAETEEDGRTWPRHRPATVVEVRVPARGRSASRFLGALDVCRVRLLLALFGTSPEKLEHLRVVKTSGDMDEVKNLLYGRQRADTIPWLTALYKSDRRRFTEVLTALLADWDLRTLGGEVMDVIDSKWPGLIASRLASAV